MPTDLEVLRAVPPEEIATWTPERQREYLAALDRAYLLESPDRFGERAIHDYQRFAHVRLMGEAIRQMVDEDACDILLIEVSVRHSKSWTCSIATPAWFLSKYPTRTVGLASYEADFAAGWGRRSRSAMEQMGPLFGISVDKRSRAAHRWDLVLPDGRIGGGMWSSGAGGQIEGKGYHLGIIDDPIKNREEAESEGHLDKVWEWWQSTFLPRGEPGAKIIIVMSRWSTEDLTGRLLADSGGKRVRSIRLPAVAEENEDLTVGRVRWTRRAGDALCPERYSADELEGLRDSVGPWTWASRFQQRPMPATGGLFRKEHFRYWSATEHGALLDLGHQKRMVDLSECVRFATADIAFARHKRADWTVACQWAVTPEVRGESGEVEHPPYLLLVARDRVRIETAEHLPLLRRAWEFVPRPAWIGVEETPSTLSLIELARRDGILVRELTPDRNKQARAETAATMCMGGRVFFPKGAPWLSEWEAELLAFPTVSHDDQVDNLAYAAIEVARGAVRGRRHKASEPTTLEERMRAQLLDRNKKRRVLHPTLGRI